MSVSQARAAAFDILLRVQERESYAAELLHSGRLDELSAPDRGLCTELVMGTLRWQSALDTEIASHTSQKLSHMDIEVLIALRLGAYQLRRLDRIPSSAAVNESVELVKRARKKSAVPFANAVLRKLAAAPPPEFTAEPTARGLSLRFAHPPWIVERWLRAYGLVAAERICEFDQQTPGTSLRVRGSQVQVTELETELRACGVSVAPGHLVKNALTVASGDASATNAFAEGRIAIQDEASQLVALLVGNGTRMLDCCAAPGGKTAVLAEANPEATIVAAELHPHRARLMAERLRASNVEIVTADATALPYGAEFDRVLADVPCTGTGTLARNPEIKWKLSRADIRDLHFRQSAILAACLRYVAPGGRVVYSTCSLEPEENEAIVESVLSTASGFTTINVSERLEELRATGDLVWNDVASLASGPYLRTLPGTHPCDGFFAAILERC